MRKQFTDIFGKPVCEACEFEKRGGKSRVRRIHSCGKSDSEEIGRDLKSLAQMKKLRKVK